MNPKDTDPGRRARLIISETDSVGLVQKPFGNNGELVVKLRETFPEDHTEPLWVEIDSMAVPLFVKSYTPQGVSKAVVIFDDFTEKIRAAMLVGKELFSGLQDDENAEESEWDFLAGYSFDDQTSSRKGAVTEYVDNSLNPLLEVEIAGESFLVPFSENLTVKINKRQKSITMSLPEGIFDL